MFISGTAEALWVALAQLAMWRILKDQIPFVECLHKVKLLTTLLACLSNTEITKKK